MNVLARRCGEVNATKGQIDNDLLRGGPGRLLCGTMKKATLLVLGVVALLVAACAQPHGAQPLSLPDAVAHPVAGTRHAMNTMVLRRDGPVEGQDLYYFSGRDAGRISVRFISQARSRITVQAVCDGRVRVRPFEYL